MLDDLFKDNMFKVPTTTNPFNVGAAVKLNASLELEECITAADPACLGVLEAFHITTDPNAITEVKDCLGNVYPRESGVEKTVYRITRLGLVHTAKLCDEGGAILAGDLLCTCTMSGYLKKQTDSTVHAHTIGQAITDITFTNGTAENQSIYLLG